MKRILSPIFRRILLVGLTAFILILGGCLSGSDVGTPFYGLWKDRYEPEFTIRDSLFRVDLHEYADGLGYYVPFELDVSEKPPEGKLRLPDSLFYSFRSECLRSDCDSVLESRRYYLRIEKDSLRSYTLLNGRLESSFVYGLRVERDSIYKIIDLDESNGLLDIEFAAAYRLYANGDSLEMEQFQGFSSYYGRSKDVLPRD